MAEYGTMRVKSGLAEMLKGGVIMDVTNAGAGADRRGGGRRAPSWRWSASRPISARTAACSRMSDPEMITAIMAAVTIPVMAKARIGHFVEAQILEALEVDYIDESEVLTPADEEHHIDKRGFTVPFVCGATNLGEALRRIAEGAAMIRTKGEAGTGNVVEAVRHMRADQRRAAASWRCSDERRAVRPRPRSCGRRLELVREVRASTASCPSC